MIVIDQDTNDWINWLLSILISLMIVIAIHVSWNTFWSRSTCVVLETIDQKQNDGYIHKVKPLNQSSVYFIKLKGLCEIGDTVKVSNFSLKY